MELEFIKQNMALVALSVFSGGMLLWSLIKGGGAPAVSPTEATVMINRDEAVVLDVRDTKEFAAGHIGDAVHVALGQLADKLADLEKYKDRPLIVSCQSGNRSLSACDILRKAGFTKLYNLNGGMAAWQQAGLPVVKKKK